MKGGVAYEATVDAEGYSMVWVLHESNNLARELELRYPISKEKE